MSGASPLAADDAHFFRGAGIPVLEGYGLAETTAPCTANTPTRTRVGRMGMPIPGTTIRVAEDGEILVKGTGVFKGYHANEDANAEAFVDRFFRTGDLGELDPEGFLTITGRKKDLSWSLRAVRMLPGTAGRKNPWAPAGARRRRGGRRQAVVAALLSLDPQGLQDWCARFTRESGHLTPSLKLKRAAVVRDFGAEIDRLFR